MKYISINTVMDRLTRHPLMEDIPYETVVDYAYDFMRIVGIPSSFEERVATVKIEQFRGELPCDLYEILQVRLKPICDRPQMYFRYSTDNFHMADEKYYGKPLTYKTQGGCIFTSVKDCSIEIAYKAIPMDKECTPLIPDNSPYLRALEAYIKLQWFTALFDTGKISQQVLKNTQQQYAWAVGAAQTDMILPTMDQMEAISNAWNRLLPDITDDYNHGFKDLGSQEHMKIH